MSHVVQVKTRVKDVAALGLATQRLQLAEPTYGTANFFDGSATGWRVSLPGWRYDAVFDVESGKVDFDDYGGRWGERAELNRLIQAYGVEKAKLEARKKGYSTSERQLEDGSIRLSIQVGGTA
ncbi:hypothetical protein Pan97_07400 [Bremerella volcania]|uniref:DUF1257 domain-containing protein n=1 Tax=Bremerella volcania TaxID=2527984 RepID=A0A518C3E0_9BACT|nr:DUF1257 domain-containing protein [Bremerella volcania]QDU73741.1 hypothetical protein Pan97_07400 [Bremerella volcania]